MIILLICCFASAGAERYIIPVPGGASDGHLTRNDITFNAACSGTKTISTGLPTFTTGDYYSGFCTVWQGFIRFEVPEFPGERILNDSLFVYVTYKGAENFHYIAAYWIEYDWFPLSSDDWLGNGSSWHVIRERAYADVQEFNWLSFSFFPTVPSVKAGEVYSVMFDTYRLCTSPDPAGRRYVTFASQNNNNPNIRPYLVVNTITPGGEIIRHIVHPGIKHDSPVMGIDQLKRK